jgi:exonuclease VII large subunit
VLDRGYALVQQPADGRVVTDASRLQEGQEVDVRLARGGFRSRVMKIKPAARPPLKEEP